MDLRLLKAPPHRLPLHEVDWFGEGLSPEQHAIRAKSPVTASRVAGMLGLSPYVSPHEVWEEIRGIRKVQDSPAMQMGRALEPIIGHWAAKELDVRINKPPTIVHAKYPWAAASADFLLKTRGEGIECKCQDARMVRDYLAWPSGHYDNDAIPLYHLIQCLWQMEVYRSHRHAISDPGAWTTWWLAVYFGGGHRRLYKLCWDQRAVDQLMTKAQAFWLRHLDPDGPLEEPSDKGWERGDQPKPRPKTDWLDLKIPVSKEYV